MSSTPPFIAQERTDACAIACLRMLLAHEGQHTTEAEAIEAAGMQQGGLTPEEVRRLAEQYGFRAMEQQLDQAALAEQIKLGRFPIVFLFRRPLDGVDATHAVLPLRIGRRYVTFLDPLRGTRRVSLRKFEKARRVVGSWVVVCRR
jgi:ABC-type bacteriocin/lantibiotic exporter with double-glycine peptidase domain